MPKIFLYCYPAPDWGVHDVIGYALAEDGTGLASHLSSNKGFSQHDMGLTSNWKHESYEKHYPEGFELEWVDDPDNHPGVAAAYALNKAAQQGVRLTDGGHAESDNESTSPANGSMIATQ